MLQLRQLHGHLLAGRPVVQLPAQVHARPPDGHGEEARGQPGALALLLLRRVLRGVPAGGPTGRDHDEPAPLADLALRLHRHRPHVLPAPVDRDRRRGRGGPAHRPRLHSLRGVRRRHPPVHGARTPSCPPKPSTSSTGSWRRCCLAFLLPNCGRMWWFTRGARHPGQGPDRAAAAARLPQGRLPVPAALHDPEALRAVRARSVPGSCT